MNILEFCLNSPHNIENDAIYKAKICKRCGKISLRKYLSTDSLDGGYTRIDKFEPYEKPWEYSSLTGTLCSECYIAYEQNVKNFMDNVKAVKA